MAVFLVAAFLVIVFALAVLLLVASDASARAGGDQTHLALRVRKVLRHLNGEADPPAALARTLIVREIGETEPESEEEQSKSGPSAEQMSESPLEAAPPEDDSVASGAVDLENVDTGESKTKADKTDDPQSDGGHLAA